MEDLIVSVLRFSAAVSLFGAEQVQRAVGTVSGSEDAEKSIDKLRTALDSFSKQVAGELDKSKQETLDSLTKMSEDTVRRAFKGMNLKMMDPTEAMKTTMDVMRKTTDSVSDWVANADDEAETNGNGSGVKNASKVLSRPKAKKVAKAAKV